MTQPTEAKGTKTVATNRKAYHDYHIVDTYEAGIVLTGTEIKSVREGRVNLRDGFAIIRDDELWLIGVHIAPYHHGNRQNHEPRRERKLLMHRREIDRLRGKLAERGWTLVPLRMYLRQNICKLEIGLVRGKRSYDKRQAIAERDAERDLRRVLKDYR